MGNMFRFDWFAVGYGAYCRIQRDSRKTLTPDQHAHSVEKTRQLPFSTMVALVRFVDTILVGCAECRKLSP